MGDADAAGEFTAADAVACAGSLHEAAEEVRVESEEFRQFGPRHVDMLPGRTGPLHAFDTEQVWTFLDGAATIDLDGRELEAAPGDTVVLPADAPRQMTAGDAGFTAVVAAHAGCLAYDPDAVVDAGKCDLAPQGDERIVPPWAR